MNSNIPALFNVEAEHPQTDELVSVSSKNRRVARTYAFRGAMDTAFLQGDIERTVHGGGRGDEEIGNGRGFERTIGEMDGWTCWRCK